MRFLTTAIPTLFASMVAALALFAVSDGGGIARAHAPSGAIFTTTSDGSEVNENIFADVHDVYLDGGPGPGAPQGAAGLDDGRYVFQVTNPSGKTLLSTDAAKCRRFDVSGGIITNVVPAGGCEHITGNDIDHPPAKTVQLFPFNQTPNPGGVFKAWVVREDDFLAGCAALGVANGLDVVNCGFDPGNAHGFVPAHTKTDNFKVKKGKGVEIDVRFFHDANNDGHPSFDASEPFLSGLEAGWTDTVGAHNKKFSYVNYVYGTNFDPYAHVEAAEPGAHVITINDSPGCNVGLVHLDNVDQAVGPQSVVVNVGTTDPAHWVYVACTP